MDKKIYDNYVAILKEELIPAMGCTEPIAVAYCAACAASVFKYPVETVTIRASANIIKMSRVLLFRTPAECGELPLPPRPE